MNISKLFLKETLNKPSPSGRGLGEGLLDQSVAQDASPSWRLNQSLLKVKRCTFLVVLFLFGSHLARAEQFGITLTELKQMPGMCRALSESHYAEDAKSLRNPNLYPAGFTSIHHFCDGLKYLLRADKSIDAQSKGGHLQEAIGNFDYVLGAKEHKAASSTQVRTYHAMTRFYKAEALRRAGKTSAMIAEYMKVTELKPNYPHAYAQLFDYYLKTGDRAEAAKVIEMGLKHAPKSKMLLKRKAKLR